jgi:hypothetical protein
LYGSRAIDGNLYGFEHFFGFLEFLVDSKGFVAFNNGLWGFVEF